MEGEKIDEDDVSCSVCLELFAQPTPLVCKHEFCRACLISLMKGSKPTLCPMCRNAFGLPLLAVNQNTVANVARFKQQQEQLLNAVAQQVIYPPYLRRDEWLVILRLLEKWDGPKAVARVGAVCKGLYRVAQDGCLWRDLCMRDFAFVPSQDDSCRPSWR